MKPWKSKSIMFCLVLFIGIIVANVAKAQNGGQNHSNDYVTITNLGWSVDGFNLKVHNKQPIDAEHRISMTGTNNVMVVMIPTGVTLSFKYIAPEACDRKIQCKPLNTVPGPDGGLVEAKCGEGPDVTSLPVRFIDIKFENKKKR